MRGLGGIADMFEALAGRESPRRFRRKDQKVGEKFDDYFVHAPRHVVEASSRQYAPYNDPSKHRSFDRPRTPRGSVPWNRVASVPRAMSEVNEAQVRRDKFRAGPSVLASRSRSHLSSQASQSHGQRFYAPNEKPVPRNRSHIGLPTDALGTGIPSAPPSPPPVGSYAAGASGATPGYSTSSYGHAPGYASSPHLSLRHAANVAIASSTNVAPALSPVGSSKKGMPLKEKKRPPPLLTGGVAHGFPGGGLREITPVPELRPSSPIVALSPPTNSVESDMSRSPSGLVRKKSGSRSRLHFSSSKKAGTRPFSDRMSPKSKPRSRKIPESDLEFEEATSISSFGDGETPGGGRAEGGLYSINNRSSDTTEVSEDVFVISPDDVFRGGGFVISRKGMLKSPGNLSRKLSDGRAVDGVPRSSNNLIIVRSLAEFSRGSSLSRKSNVDSTLGAGAAGRVSLAIHRPSRRKIAVKRINVYDIEKRNQLLKELETLMSYDSRFLVRSYGAFYDGEGVVHVTLEYMDRGALSDVIELRGKVPEHITAHIAEHCLRGLMFLHDNRVLHRDFKTSNILLSRRVCRAKLSDFGLVRDLHPGKSKADSFVGTIAYMSPERLDGSEYTYASDIWGLGISVLECFLGRYPFPKTRSFFDYLKASKSNPSKLMSGASPACIDFVRLCTCANPLERPTARNLLKHPWLRETRRDANAFRSWLESIPEAHNGDGFGDGNGLKRAKERANEVDMK